MQKKLYSMAHNPLLATSIGPYIGKASRVLEKRINDNFADAGYEVTLDHMIVMMHLWKEDGQNQKTLCGLAGRNKTMITRIIDNLEKKNRVLRITDKEDRRNKLVYLTHKGKVEKKELEAVLIQTMKEATAGIPESELDICKKVLYKVFVNLADEDFAKHYPLNRFT